MNSSSSPEASPPPSAATTTAEQDFTTAGFSNLHPDIIESHILKRLDGVSLSTLSCCSATLHHLSSQNNLWSNMCHSTWPSTSSQRVNHFISTFPDGGPRSFFANAFPLLVELTTAKNLSPSSPSAPLPSELISAVDIRYQDQLIFTKVQETETVTGWFRCSPFRIDLLEPKDVVPTPIKHPEGDTCTTIINHMTLSWILIDPIGRRAVNLSSHKPVTVQRHWLTGEMQVRFATILTVDHGHVQCETLVTCGVSEGGDMQGKEVSLQIEDRDGMHLIGKDSLVILQRALEGKKGGRKPGLQEGQMRYKKFVEMRRERRERKLRRDVALDLFCVAFWVSTLLALFWRFQGTVKN
ncbi:probable F-box protein At2g36090 [Olea europaea var. sylvestris]|uniref:probable F-box protein At2g36090 n=1 Tax=Olea europaea var. sylvestris TaxID=158386 RepID=UPI000C1D380A|nr:probable F-box protein At2g36090 [Olea europaea var. sylvestris]